MANTTVTKTQVLELTKFGFKDGNGAYVGYSPKMPEKDKALIVPGRTLEVEMYVADSGKQYVNKVVSQNTENVTKSTPKVTATASEAMTRADWDNKDLRISRQGAVQTGFKVAATIAPAPKLKEVAYKIADEIMEYVRGK